MHSSIGEKGIDCRIFALLPNSNFFIYTPLKRACFARGISCKFFPSKRSDKSVSQNAVLAQVLTANKEFPTISYFCMICSVQ